jgi:hypothetical protein
MSLRLLPVQVVTALMRSARWSSMTTACSYTAPPLPTLIQHKAESASVSPSGPETLAVPEMASAKSTLQVQNVAFWHETEVDRISAFAR